MISKKIFVVAIAVSLAVGTSSAAIAASSTPVCVYKYLNLSAFVNHNATDDFGLGYENLPLGTVIKSPSETPFIVRPRKGNILIGLHGYWAWEQFPMTVNIPFNDTAKTIYFFGQVHAGMPFDGIHGKYVINYFNGTSVEIPLDGNSTSSTWNIDDHCCNWRAENLPAASVAWEDLSQLPMGSPALFREFVWNNPFPQLTITSISFHSADDGVSPMLFAITYLKCK